MIDRLREVVRVLSGREREVLAHIARGATYREIARRMDVSLHTVDTYIRRIRAKTGSRHRMHLLLLALSVDGSLVSAIEDLGLSVTPKPPPPGPGLTRLVLHSRSWPPAE
ncbi:helix-turn-helix transcriptional regulator [Streptomyces sp. NPDC046409]|uniref:response regulator transcription factor n=1 Tax=Streptomyces sp. NPDC046409 TaxID=3156675 RepID=UPI0034080DF6